MHACMSSHPYSGQFLAHAGLQSNGNGKNIRLNEVKLAASVDPAPRRRTTAVNTKLNCTYLSDFTGGSFQ